MKVIRIVLALLLTIVVNPANAEIKSALKGAVDSLQIDITSQYITASVPSLGGEEFAIHTESTKEKFYTVPVLIPNWKEYKKELDKLTVNKGEEDEFFTIKLFIEYWNSTIEKELVDKINEKRKSESKKEISNNDLSILLTYFLKF